tara:strand:+ start:1902 stop:2297 length:396 start_codon:yes stop_codon:yes gene_type:complete
LKASLNQSTGTNDRSGSDYRFIHYHGIHTDHRVLPNNATVENCAMPHMAIFLNHRIRARKRVHHAIILNIRTFFEYNSAKITTQRGGRPHVAAGTNPHVPNQNRRWVNVCGRMNNRLNAFDTVGWHASLLH